MAMDDDDLPLLHDADLMDVLLGLAAEGEATLDAAVERIRAHLALARETMPIPETELRRRLDHARRSLAAARLIEPAEGEPFRATARGHKVLADHPDGIDDSVLAHFPEFREFIRRESGPPPRAAETTVYDEGHAAYRAGKSPADNPYPFDTTAHLNWENGWFEARDEAADHAFPRPRD